MKKIFTVRALILTSLITFPLLVSAQSGLNATQGITTLGRLVDTFNQSIVKSLATLFASAAMVAFFYGIVQYVWGLREGVAKQIEDGQKFMVWGLVSLFVMFSVWGIVQYAQNVFGIQGQNTIVIPSINIQSGGSGPLPTGANPGSSSALPTGANTTQSQAINTYQSCVANGGSASQCQTAYQSAGGTGSGSASYNNQATAATNQANCEDKGWVYTAAGSCEPVAGTPNQTQAQADQNNAQINCADAGGIFNTNTNTCSI